MTTVSLRVLRNNFSSLERLLREGELIQIEKRGVPIAFLSSAKKEMLSRRVKKPNFAARRKALWKKRVFTPQEVLALRNDELGSED